MVRSALGGKSHNGGVSGVPVAYKSSGEGRNAGRGTSKGGALTF